MSSDSKRQYNTMIRRLILLILLLPLAAAPAGASAQAGERCFPATGYCIGGTIRAYWESNGGLSVFGYPIGDLHVETVEGGWSGPVQWFERDRLEDHGNDGLGVLAGRLGAATLDLRWTPWQTFGQVESAPVGCVMVTQTRHSLCGPFLSYWRANGGLERFGFPITEPFAEQIEGNSYTVQYFERRRMELHPELPGQPILLGLLGRQTHDLVAPVMANGYPACRGAIIESLRLSAERLFGPEVLGCPVLLPQVDIPGSYQRFEHGIMIWFSPRPAPPAGSLPPTVLAISTPDMRVTIVSDTWQAGKDPERAAGEPPADL
jgi:hypothetical protein